MKIDSEFDNKILFKRNDRSIRENICVVGCIGDVGARWSDFIVVGIESGIVEPGDSFGRRLLVVGLHLRFLLDRQAVYELKFHRP